MIPIDAATLGVVVIFGLMWLIRLPRESGKGRRFL